MLELKDVTYTYDGSEAGIREVSFVAPREKTFAILGQSGAGKTTLLQCVARFLRPQSGSISLDGDDIYRLEELDFRRRLGIVFQRLFLFPHMNILENLKLAPVRVLHRPEKETEEEGRELLEQFQIADLAESYPNQISGGQAQRAAICRSLLLHPEYILLDEPTAALDVGTTARFAEFITSLQTDTTFIIVTHDVEFAEVAAEHGVLMKDGSVVGSGDVKDLVTELREDNGND